MRAGINSGILAWCMISQHYNFNLKRELMRVHRKIPTKTFQLHYLMWASAGVEMYNKIQLDIYLQCDWYPFVDTDMHKGFIMLDTASNT